MTGCQDTDSGMRLRVELRALVGGLTFLTRIPIARWVALDGDDLARAGPAFPLVGAGIGTAVGATAAGLAQPLSPFLAVALALATGALITGALHLDALADTADALGARSREHALEVMRDHSVGSYGAVAVGLALLIEAAALTELVHQGHALRFAVVAGALSRGTAVVLGASLPSARGEGAGMVLTRGGRGRASLAAAIAVAIAVAVAGVDGVIVAVCAGTAAAAFAFAGKRWIGGVTGDTLGAAVQVTQLLVLVVAVALVGTG